MSETREITLKFPLNDGGQKIDSITIRRPKVRDMLSSAKNSGSDAENEVILFAGLCDIPPKLIESMDLVDYQQLQAAYSGFLD